MGSGLSFVNVLFFIIGTVTSGCGSQNRPIEETNCGDSVVSASEECDDGQDNSDTLPNACRTHCELPYCGDGVADDDELCDDGNDNEEDSCHNDCTNCLDSMNAISYEAGADTWGLALGDLDNDNDLDVVATNSGEDTISVFFNTGSGELLAPTHYDTGNGPNAVALGDYNRDGFLDVAVANAGVEGNSVSVHRNHGDGTLADATPYDVLTGPYAMTAADLDNDGDLDLLVLSRWAASLVVLWNNGNGIFVETSTFETGNEPLGLVAGDVDHDGDLDVVVANFGDDGISILFNTGSGTLELPTNYASGRHPWAVALGDIDNDGDQDLAVANSDVGTRDRPGNVTIHFNSGNGVFDEENPIAYDAGQYPLSLALGDLDGDGDLDLAAVSRDSDSATVKLNRGDGTFSGAAFYGGNRQPRSVAIGDLDGDGDLDLAIANFASDEVVILESNCL